MPTGARYSSMKSGTFPRHPGEASQGSSEGTFERLGSAKPIHSDFRVIAATNKDLAAEVGKGAFRQDLYYRLNVFPIHVPPLRDRKRRIRPIPLFCREVCQRKKMGKRFASFSPDELRKLKLEYHWPGNLRDWSVFSREGRHLSRGGLIACSSLKPPSSGLPSDEDRPGRGAWKTWSVEYIRRALHATGWRVSGPKARRPCWASRPPPCAFAWRSWASRSPPCKVAGSTSARPAEDPSTGRLERSRPDSGARWLQIVKKSRGSSFVAATIAAVPRVRRSTVIRAKASPP